MAIMYISDLHFGHANIIKIDKRPFSDVEEMNQKMIENWNNKVKSDDWVYILGDFCWGILTSFSRGNSIISALSVLKVSFVNRMATR